MTTKSPKPPRNLLTQITDQWNNFTRKRNTAPLSPPSTGIHTVVALCTGLKVTLGGKPLSPATLAVLAPYQPVGGFAGTTYLFPWVDALDLYPAHRQTALPSAVAQALEVPDVALSGLEAPEPTTTDTDYESDDDTDLQGEGVVINGSEQADERAMAFAELQAGLPALDTVGSLEAKIQLFGHDLSLTACAGQKPLDLGPAWMTRVGSFGHVGVPLWLWQLHQAKAPLHALLNNPDTRTQAYGLLQQVHEAVQANTPQHNLTLDARQLDGQKFVSVTTFQVAVAKSRYGSTADVLPYSEALEKSLDLPEAELKRSIQQALADWNGQGPLILKDSQQNDVYASILLTPQQTEAIKHLKEALFQKPQRDIKHFVYFPTKTALGQAFQEAFQLDLSEFGPRVTGIGPIVFKGGMTGGAKHSLLDRMGLADDDLPVADRGDDGSVGEVPTESPMFQIKDAEGDNPLLALTLPTSNDEDDLTVSFPLETMPQTLEAMKAQLDDDTQTDLFTLTDAVTQEPVELPLDAAFVNELYRETKALTQGQAYNPFPEEPADTRQYLQTAPDGEFREGSETPTTLRWFAKAQQWAQAVPHLKPHITLFPYQQEGVTWLLNAFLKGNAGVLFADDMGLGKTLQSLAFLSVLMDRAWYERHHKAGSMMFDKNAFKVQRQKDGATGPDKGHYPHPILVIVPPVLMKNFKKQAADFFNNADDAFNMLLLHGEQGEPGQPMEDCFLKPRLNGPETNDGVLRLDKALLHRYRIVVTTYDYAVRYQHSLGRIRWSVLLCDEVQKAKNANSKWSSALKCVGSNACFKIMMTGTPIENDCSDLYNLMDMATSGTLASSLKAFKQAYKPLFDIDLSEDPDTANAQIEDSMTQLKTVLAFGDIQQGHMIGRMKEQVGQGLPNLIAGEDQEIVNWLSMEEYNQVWNRYSLPLLRLQALKAHGMHPNPHDVGQGAQGLAHWVAQSPRISAVMDKLDEIQRKGEKALLFCELIPIQETLQKALNQRYGLPNKLKAINSNLTDKMPVIETFQQHGGFCALVLSPRCAGMGLNLQEANHVFHVSRWWNPAVEDQATCRAYRTGQTKDVYVYYCFSRLKEAMAGEQTFDEVLHELLAEKRRKRTDLLSPGYGQDISEHHIIKQMKR